MCVFLGRAMKFFWPQSRGGAIARLAPPPPRGSAVDYTIIYNTGIVVIITNYSWFCLKQKDQQNSMPR